VREREWEASQTVWLWADLSPSMDFRSHLSQTTKLDRAVVLMLALAEMLGRGGERVGVPGLAEPRIGRDSASRVAELLSRADLTQDWPKLDRVGRFADVVMLSDCLTVPEVLEERLRSVAGRGANLHLLQIFDPVEESFPYEGRLEFRDPESGATWLTERAGGLREDYRVRLAAHRELIAPMPGRPVLLRRPPYGPARGGRLALPAGPAFRPGIPCRIHRRRRCGLRQGSAPPHDRFARLPLALASRRRRGAAADLAHPAADPAAPRQVDFPPTRILLGLQDRERTPARTPWWLTALRLALVALIIGALAEPVLRPDLRLTAGTEPLLIVLDNGWDAAPDFADRIAAAETALAEAARDGRPCRWCHRRTADTESGGGGGERSGRPARLHHAQAVSARARRFGGAA
jgi:hypothetical protein